jgi:hypothetical protein
MHVYVTENDINLEMLGTFTNRDIEDLFKTFKDRYIIRRFIEALSQPQNLDVKQEKQETTPPHDHDHDQTLIQVLSTDKHATPRTPIPTPSSSTDADFSVDQLLDKKKVRGKSSPAQARFHTVIKDAAMAAHIWRKAPQLIAIPSTKQAAFIQKVDEMLPILRTAADQRRVWVRLGQHLQNRRKYLSDKANGKRSGRKLKAHGVVKSPNLSRTPRKSPNHSRTPRKSPNHSRTPRKSPNHSRTPQKLPNAIPPLESNVSIATSNNEQLGTAIFLGKRNEMFGEFALHTKLPKNSGSVDLPEATPSGTTTFADLKIKENFLWKLTNIIIKDKGPRKSASTAKKSPRKSVGTDKKSPKKSIGNAKKVQKSQSALPKKVSESQPTLPKKVLESQPPILKKIPESQRAHRKQVPESRLTMQIIPPESQLPLPQKVPHVQARVQSQ